MKRTTMFFFMLILVVSISSGAPGQEIKVGILLPYTGALKEYGPNVQNGAVLAAKQMGSAGLEIELLHADSQTTADAAKTAAQKLVEEDKVVAVVGALSSGVTMAVAESVTCPNDILMISPGSTSPLLTTFAADKDKDFLFRTCPSDTLQGVVLAKLASGHYKTASVMYVDNTYGQGLAKQFKKSFEIRGGIVLAMVPHPEKAESFVLELKKALARFTVPQPPSFRKARPYLDNPFVMPDVLCVFSYAEQAKVYVKEAVDLFVYRSFLFCDGSKSRDMIRSVGPENLDGMMGTAPGVPGGESFVNFSLDFTAEFGKIPPLPFIANAYDAMAVIGLAAYAAKAKGLTLTSKNIKDHLRIVANPPGASIKPGEFKKAFELLSQGKEIDYDGVTGAVDFDQNGDVVTPIEVWQYSLGKIVTSLIEYQIPIE